MKVALLLLCICVCITLSRCDEKYDDRYDNINIDNILSNDRILTSYINCCLGKGACTKEGRLLKQDLPDAIETSCDKCTDSQKNIVRKAAKHIMEHRPEDWKKLIDKFDPNGEHSESFKNFVNEQ